MSDISVSTSGSLTNSRLFAALIFVAIIAGCIAASWFAVADILDHRRALSDSTTVLEQMQGRRPGGQAAAGSERAGSPYLEGPTVTVAGASLLQRVAAALTKAGGTVQSSQIDVEGARTRNGFVSLVVSCEIDQPALQGFLYDLEAGMPFLFVDQLDIYTPQAAAMNAAAPIRVRMVVGVSAQWQEGK